MFPPFSNLLISVKSVSCVQHLFPKLLHCRIGGRLVGRPARQKDPEREVAVVADILAVANNTLLFILTYSMVFI